MSRAETIELKVDEIVDDRYRICRCIGRGGMGTVYEAQQIKLRRKVALKVLRLGDVSWELAAKRFEREAKAASSVEHRNVVRILDFGQLASGELYYTMELLEGRDLSRVMSEQGALPWSRAGWIILQVVRAFAAIHDKGIVHRDIKPANCFLLDPRPGDEPDFVKILDFGIANLQDKSQGDTTLTGHNDVIGSIHYMAPEQAASDHVDARTDIYSLGIMMYELLTGELPFADPNPLKAMFQHRDEAPRPPRALVPSISRGVEAIILKAIAKEPQARFQSMREVEAALLPLLALGASAGSSSRSPAVLASSRGGPVVHTPGGLLDSVEVPTVRRITQPSGACRTRVTVGSSMASEVEPPAGLPRAKRRKAWVLPAVMVLVVTTHVLALMVWLRRMGEGEVVREHSSGSGEPRARELVEIGAVPPRHVLPPEPPHDPIADPFGAPPLRMGTGSRGPAAGDGTQATGPLATRLAPGSWMLEPGTIAGWIMGREQRPLAHARVCAFVVDPRAPLELRRGPRCTEADRRGRFVLRDLPPSAYELSASARGFIPQGLLARDGHPLVVQPGDRREGIVLALSPGGAEVRGTVKTAEGVPLVSARVSAVGAVRSLAITDDAGAFSLWGAEGDVAVVASADGYVDLVVRGRADEPLALVLRRESVLVGRVVDAATGEPVEMARVRAGPRAGGIDPLVHTNEHGEFEIAALPAGSYVPTARTDTAYGQAKRPVRLEEGTLSAEVVIEVSALEVATPAPSVPVVSEEPTPTKAVPTKAAPGRPASSNSSIRRAVAAKLRRCGTDGKIEITASRVLDSGELVDPRVRVTGNAGKDLAVAKCAEAIVGTMKLMPRKQPTVFKTLVLEI